MVTIFPLVIVLIPFVLGCCHNYCYEDDDQDSPNTLSTSVWFADVRASDGDGRLLQRGACGVCASRVDVALLQRSPACASRIGACSRRVPSRIFERVVTFWDSNSVEVRILSPAGRLLLRCS